MRKIGGKVKERCTKREEKEGGRKKEVGMHREDEETEGVEKGLRRTGREWVGGTTQVSPHAYIKTRHTCKCVIQLAPRDYDHANKIHCCHTCECVMAHT